MVPNANKQPSAEPLLVRPREAWRMLGCGNTFGYGLINAGELESFLDGTARKITVDLIKCYIERKLAGSAKGETAQQRRRRSDFYRALQIKWVRS